MRKIIQIATQPASEGEEWYSETALYALADDGSLWVRDVLADEPAWRRLDDIPQDAEENG